MSVLVMKLILLIDCYLRYPKQNIYMCIHVYIYIYTYIYISIFDIGHAISPSLGFRAHSLAAFLKPLGAILLRNVQEVYKDSFSLLRLPTPSPPL